jgi:hypothetical protein
MRKVKVYKFAIWDQQRGAHRIAPRMGTRRFIKAAGGIALEETEREVNASLIDGNGQADISVQPTK